MEYLYLALPDDGQDMAVFTNLADCTKYLLFLGCGPADYEVIPLNPELPINLSYKVFDGYVRYIKGDITFLHYSISQYISYAPQSYIISKAPDQELYDGVPVKQYCKIPIKNEILTNVKIPYSDFIKNIAKSEIEKQILTSMENNLPFQKVVI